MVLQEASSPRVVAQLARDAGFTHWGSRAGASTGFLSRIPVTDWHWHHPRGARHAFLEVALGTGLRVFVLHLNAWFSRWSERRRAYEIRALLDGIREHQQGPHVIIGDFNALAPGALLQVRKLPAWIRAMVWLSGRDIARTTIQHMLDAQYADVWRRLHPGEDGFSFPTWDPHVRLDYAFVPERLLPQVAGCEILRTLPGAHTASDHFPLAVTFGD